MRGKAQNRAQCGKPIAKGHIVSFLGIYILFINPVTAGPSGREIRHRSVCSVCIVILLIFLIRIVCRRRGRERGTRIFGTPFASDLFHKNSI